MTVGFVSAQDRTVGLMLNEAGSFNGYTLFAPLSYTTTYLINNEGLLVHSWVSEYLPGSPVYLGRDGFLYRSINIFDTAGVMGLFGGGVEKIDWDGKVVWHYEYVSNTHRAHHDIGVLPNGNVLMIAWESKDSSEMIAAGRDPALLPPGPLLPEHVIEVRPEGATGGTIVWEWHVWNHLIQDYNPARNNYGVVTEHPELINLNYVAGGEVTSDWIHANAVSYNEAFDQILLTSRFFSEIWVIDHSTTTAQAHGHTGGKFGKGGDLLYRWGNPQAYGLGTENDQQLFFPHDGDWISAGLPGAGNILIFNNGGGTQREYSSVDEIVPPVDEHGNYTGGLPFSPKAPVWTYSTFSRDFFSPIIGGVQRLPNGTTLVCDGPNGIFFEVTTEGEVVWRYINPVNKNGPVYQGDSIVVNAVFKIRRYPADYAGLLGKDLTPGGPIEKYHAVEEEKSVNHWELKLYPNIFRHSISIAYQLSAAGHVRIKVYNILGREVRTLVDEVKPAGSCLTVWDGTDNQKQRLSAGVYFLTLTAGGNRKMMKVVRL
jgi:hypothetical protein